MVLLLSMTAASIRAMRILALALARTSYAFHAVSSAAFPIFSAESVSTRIVRYERGGQSFFN